ncbi:MAG: histidine--tRNA ligase [Fibromonadaceae bacterium]|jgi:histidyl-tRNA synthetase|nr:histidine--tRNA ligase [Fibromonadaceae bacterium]
MKQTPPLPKGTRDFYPAQMRVQNRIFSVWRRAAEKFGYEEYEGPTFEHLELYTGKSGDEIVSQLYNFTDKGERALALRPEMTPTLARLVIQKGNELKKPFKWFSMPRLFRYERSQKGRLREFFQLNLDIIGTDSISAEADLLAAIASMLFDFGLSENDFAIGVSSRKLLAAFLENLSVAEPNLVYPILDKRLKMPAEDFQKELLNVGLSEENAKKLNAFMACESIEDLKKFCDGIAIAELEELFELLSAAGFENCVKLDLSVVRGLAYYTGIVFEVFDKAKNMRAIAGGGRYDNLTETLGGQKITGVGFGMGDVVLADLLAEKNLLSQSRSDLPVFIASFSGDMKTLFKTATEFRKKGVACSHSLNVAKFGKQLEMANAAGAKCVIFADGEKSKDGVWEYKVLASGEQGTDCLENILRSIENA